MNGRRVLLADDEAHITHLVSRRLESLGHEVRVAQDGEEAWAICQEWFPDLIVTDLQMPYLSGIELATRLRGLPQTAEIPILMLTARGYILEDEQIADARITEMLSKPFSVRRLVERVQELLAQSEGEKRDAA